MAFRHKERQVFGTLVGIPRGTPTIHSIPEPGVLLMHSPREALLPMWETKMELQASTSALAFTGIQGIS